MREAIGATWILGIVLAFIALFSGYLAFSVNYSKAFRMKDGIIDRIEKHSGPSTEAIKDIDDFMNEIGYSSKGRCKSFFNDTSLKWAGVDHGVASSAKDLNSGEAFNYCVQRVDAYNTNGQLSASYYKVYVFFSISLPFMGTGGNLFHVTGETGNIYYPDDSLPYK